MRPVKILRRTSGTLIGVVIGTDRKVYTESGGGWRQVGNGVANLTAAPQSLWLFKTDRYDRVKVLGTDNRN